MCIYRGIDEVVRRVVKPGTRGCQRESGVWPLIHHFGGV